MPIRRPPLGDAGAGGAETLEPAVFELESASWSLLDEPNVDLSLVRPFGASPGEEDAIRSRSGIHDRRG